VNRRQQSAVPGREVCGKRRDSGSLLQRCSTARNVSTCGGRSVDLRGASPVHVCVRPCVGGRIQDPGWGQFTAARSEARTGQERAQQASANPIPSVARPSVPAAAELLRGRRKFHGKERLRRRRQDHQRTDSFSYVRVQRRGTLLASIRPFSTGCNVMALPEWSYSQRHLHFGFALIISPGSLICVG
jgi:hypothetical protein